MVDEPTGIGITTTGEGTVVVAEFGESGAWIELDEGTLTRCPDWTPEADTDE